MSDSFDPYHVWLGIPPAEQPPNHYRLLALAIYEDVPEVIENAADRQMAHVRKAASGRHADHSQKLLNEISAARRCLLDSTKKQEYDAQLRDKERPPAQKPAAKPAAKPAMRSGARTTNGHSVSSGIEATTEWVPTRPPKRASNKPPSLLSAQPLADDSDRWKGRSASAPEAKSSVPLNLGAPTSVAHRTRGKKQLPWVLFAVIAGLAILPILALLYALASVSNFAATGEGDSTLAGVTEGDDSDSDASADGLGLPVPGESHSDGDDEPGFEQPPRPPRPNPSVDPYDNRDPLDNTPSFGSGRIPADLDRGLVAYWNFSNSGIQRPAIDRGNVGEPDQQSSRSPDQTTGLVGEAVKNPVLRWQHAPWLERSEGAFTFAIWFRPHSVSGSMSIAGKRQIQAPGREWHLIRSADRVFARFHGDGAENKELLLASPVASLKQNRWAFAALRFDATGSVDGYRQTLWVGTEDSGRLLRQDSQTEMTMPVTSTDFCIGDDDSGVPLKGELDEAAYWNRALTGEEVNSYYNGGKGRAAPF